MSVSTRVSDPQALSESSAGLLRELVAHLRQNRTQLREEWARAHHARGAVDGDDGRGNLRRSHRGLRQLRWRRSRRGPSRPCKRYSRRLSERIIPRGVETDEVVGIVLPGDVLARSLFTKYQDNVPKN